MKLFELFKRSAPPQPDVTAADEGSKERKSLLAAVSKGSLSSQKCGICGEVYDQPKQTPLLVIEVKDWELDLGGYCSHCHQYLCPKHVRLATSGTVDILGTKHDAYIRECVACQTKLTDKEEDDPEVPPPSAFVAGIELQ